MARKKHLQEVLNVSLRRIKKPTLTLPPTLEIVFSSSNLEGIILGNDDPMVIFAIMVNTEVKRVLLTKVARQISYFKMLLTNSDSKTPTSKCTKKSWLAFQGKRCT